MGRKEMPRTKEEIRESLVNDQSTFKIVNGEKVELTDEEKNKILDDAVNDIYDRENSE
jgi:hypothetical protein|tara:strand:+ start:1125 stop:1298 length:174 start_codon:yes stop_codon:yes gene_type:complete